MISIFVSGTGDLSLISDQINSDIVFPTVNNIVTVFHRCKVAEMHSVNSLHASIIKCVYWKVRFHFLY